MSHTPIMLDVAFEPGKSIVLGNGDRGIAVIPNDGGKREQERLDNAHRITALWNMAERLGLSTEEIEGIASDTNSEATVECFLGCPKSNDLMKKYMRKHYRRTR
jgi:hypothetical protein